MQNRDASRRTFGEKKRRCYLKFEENTRLLTSSNQKLNLFKTVQINRSVRPLIKIVLSCQHSYQRVSLSLLTLQSFLGHPIKILPQMSVALGGKRINENGISVYEEPAEGKNCSIGNRLFSFVYCQGRSQKKNFD